MANGLFSQTEKNARDSSRFLSKHIREQGCRSESRTTGPSDSCRSTWNQSSGRQLQQRVWISWLKANCSKIQARSSPRATLPPIARSPASIIPPSMVECNHQALRYKWCHWGLFSLVESPIDKWIRLQLKMSNHQTKILALNSEKLPSLKKVNLSTWRNSML